MNSVFKNNNTGVVFVLFAKRLYIALLITLLASCSKISDQKTFYFAHNLSVTHPVHKGVLEMQRALDKISGGKLQIKIFPDGQLGSEREVLELLQIGSIAMTKVSAAAMSNFAPEYKVFGVPYLFRDRDHFFAVLEGGIGNQILEGGSDYLLRGLCYYDAGARSFYTTKKLVETPADLHGMKIRVMGDQNSVNMIGALGGSATPMAYSELYTALQQGVVDGAENNIPSFVISNHYEISQYYTVDEHSRIPDVVVIGTRFWDNLSDEERIWVKQAADIGAAKQKVFWDESVKENIEILKKANVTIYYPDKSIFAEQAKAVMETVAEDPELNELIKAILETNAENI